MIFEEFKEFAFGYTALTEVDGKHKDMLMDIGIYKFNEGETLSLLDEGRKSPSTSGWYSHNEVAGSGTEDGTTFGIR